VTNIIDVILTKSARTKQHIQRVAVDLITERGYDNTTVEDISRAAGVSHMTFFRHFPTKESVILDDPFDPLIAAAVAAQPRDLPPLERACRGLRAAVADLDLPEEEQAAARIRIGTKTPTLTAGMWANTVATQNAVAEALGGSEPTLEHRAAAAATIGALTAGILHWGTGETGQSMGQALRRALDVLDPAVA
jgi:AcrR family transcriptional regulator